MKRERTITSKLEDYLEAILKLHASKGAARVRDIATELSVHKSTVSSTLKTLAEKGLVNYTPYEIATLTADGRKIAEEVAENHMIIKRFLTDILLIDEELAGENACRMEHVTDKKVMRQLVLFARFLKDSTVADNDWVDRFSAFVKAKKGKRIEGFMQVDQSK
ncbi:MAG: metal-dependent transcriptional regulator [Kiritimatiellia bacterium]|jgi:DtxR family Mn-dependent transcriptional regulator|nr:metal-dependent transcriptional regulator [Kiritimatiellia bacterium]